MSVTQVVRDYVSERPEGKVVRSHPDRRPFVGVLTPAWHHSRDGADMPALILPPPCEIEFRVGEGEAPATLRARAGAGAGVDVSALKLLPDERERATFVFEVLVDGRSVFDERIRVERSAKPPGSEWVDVGGATGVPVEPGQLVTLRTAMLEPHGGRIEPPVALPPSGSAACVWNASSACRARARRPRRRTWSSS